jgi:hypothetical protein
MTPAWQAGWLFWAAGSWIVAETWIFIVRATPP